MRILQPKGWPRPKGFSNGILAEGKTIFVAGQIGWNRKEQMVSNDFVEQTSQVLKNIVDILEEGGAKPQHLTRLTWYITHMPDYLNNLREIGKVYSEVIGRHYPVMTLVMVAGLAEQDAKVEIEATAVIPN
ncbi:MAG: RidA family protein [SAR324 cluster bacterium]|nr:RidA family protein [SAR324 cluster bacterium]